MKYLLILSFLFSFNVYPSSKDIKELSAMAMLLGCVVGYQERAGTFWDNSEKDKAFAFCEEFVKNKTGVEIVI